MDIIFNYLKDIFNKHGFRLFMIGGASRDYLLNRNIVDYDFVTDATPFEIEKFLKVDNTFEKFGTVKFEFNNKKIDIVTLREEGEYNDSRHPSFIKFVKEINVDYKRRDFTINAIYIDENYQIIDPTGLGIEDLKNKILRIIGDPEARIKEDPLRILRANRFCIEYGLVMEEGTKKAIDKNKSLLDLINKDKINEEIKKLEKVERVLKWMVQIIKQ